MSAFVAVVEAGGFSAAAGRLNLSRSAVAKTVGRLESRLGVRLLHRTTRRSGLTEEGQTYYEHCLRALQDLRAGEAMVDSGRHEAAGRLRVSMPVLFGRRCVAPILTGLIHTHPKLELDLNFSDRLVDLAEDGFDLAVRNGPLGPWPGLMRRRIALQRMTVCASPAYLRAHGTPARLEDLQDHEAILYARPGGPIRTWVFPTSADPDVEILPRARLRFDDLEAIADAAAAGLGLAWLPCWLIRRRVGSGELVLVLRGHPSLAFECHAVLAAIPASAAAGPRGDRRPRRQPAGSNRTCRVRPARRGDNRDQLVDL